MHRAQPVRSAAQRRFPPFFWTQFLGACNDNVYKNALIIFVAYHARRMTALTPSTLVNLAGGVFIPPFLLFSATAGQLADKYEKSRLIRYIKLFEIAIMVHRRRRLLAAQPDAAARRARLMGLHSTLFGPVKYAILPQHLQDRELVGGNGLVEMGTFVAILLGTIVGGVLVAVRADGPVWPASPRVVVAVAGLARRAARFPQAPAAAPDLKINWNPFTETWENLRIRAAATAWCSCRCSASPGSGSTARCSSRSFPTTPRTCWAATSTW